MTPIDPMLPSPWIVRQVTKETKDTFTLALAPSDGTAAAFRPGQFNMLWAFGVGEAPISISGDPSDDGHLVYTVVRRTGHASRGEPHPGRGDWNSRPVRHGLAARGSSRQGRGRGSRRDWPCASARRDL